MRARRVGAFVGLVGALWFVVPGRLAASRGGWDARGPLFLKEGVGVRALGLGNAGVVPAGDAASLFWNPAGLQDVDRPEAFFQHELGLEGAATDAVGFVRPVWWARARRTWGVSFVRRTDGAVDVVEDENLLGRATPAETMAAASFAQAWRWWNVGATVKWVRQETFQHSAQAFAADVGLSGADAAGRLRWGAALANVGTPLRPGSTALPTVWRTGAAWRFARRERGRWRHDWDALLEYDRRAGDRAAGHGGLEYGVTVGSSTFRARLGWRTDRRAAADRPTVGAGWSNDRWRVNYAFAPSAAPGALHRLDVGRRFGAVLPAERRRDELWASARAAVAEGRWIAARDLLRALRDGAPDFYPARRLAADVGARMEQSLDPETLFLLGHAALEGDDPERAQDFFRKLLIVRPEHAEARAALRRAEVLSAERRDARLRAQVARERRREDESLASRARALGGVGRWVEALGLWETRAARDPDGAKAGLAEALDHVAALADAAEREEQWETARDLLRRLSAHRDVAARLAAAEKRWTAARLERGRALYADGLKAYKAGERARARALFEEALTLMPSDPGPRRALERLDRESAP